MIWILKQIGYQDQLIMIILEAVSRILIWVDQVLFQIHQRRILKKIRELTEIKFLGRSIN